jgi:radical SAM superfamily enzyme YgiQ (UPF0313 family)
MKFSFISPSPAPETPGKVEAAWPPLGILYCAALLAENGTEVSVLDQAALGYSSRQAIQWIKKENPDILGFSVLLTSYKEAVNIARQVKTQNPDIVVVFGNYHATFNAEKIIEKYPFVDIIVRGEGEHTSLELVKCLEKRGNLKDVAGITFRKNGKAVSTPPRPLSRDLDSLPIPNRSLINAKYSSDIFGIKVATRKFTSIVSSRGCPFGCSFCACTMFAQRLWRPRSVENIMNELHFLQSQDYEQFLFVDDNFTLNPKRVIKLCRKIRKEKLDIEWFCDSRVDNCTYDMLREMAKAGCKLLYFGIESANQRILDYYKKGITPEQSRSAVRKARKSGIDVIVGSFIVGAPDETIREIENTLKFAHELDIDVPQLNVLGAFPGTATWNELVAKGYIDENQHWEDGVYVSEVSPHAVPLPLIRSLIYDYFRAFYLRPEMLFKEIFRTFKSGFRMAAFFSNLTRVNQIIETVRQEVNPK